MYVGYGWWLKINLAIAIFVLFFLSSGGNVGGVFCLCRPLLEALHVWFVCLSLHACVPVGGMFFIWVK